MVGVLLGDGVDVGVSVPVAVPVGVGVLTSVGVGVLAAVAVDVLVGVGVRVLATVKVAVAATVLVGVTLGPVVFVGPAPRIAADAPSAGGLVGIGVGSCEKAASQYTSIKSAAHIVRTTNRPIEVPYGCRVSTLDLPVWFSTHPRPGKVASGNPLVIYL